jgi:hypothetical protein
MEAVCTSETSVDNHFTRQYNPEDSSEQHYYSLVSIYVFEEMSHFKSATTNNSPNNLKQVSALSGMQSLPAP